jgi:hypothetical protein
MNKRIQQLARQAGFIPDLNWDHTDWHAAGHSNLFEKFAELIVQECVREIESYSIPVGNSAAGEIAYVWTCDALKEVRDNIKEHFGIKE